ncbi:EsaB/YukD family protein [Virgibacillus sp. W0181]|uniref:EsaB/YukD family protein n=1 Tax=Virgibacillus sp. W0181 TaxID=3391581 RepID=UPI003F465C6E
MYIEVSVDLKNYEKKSIDLRLSDQHDLKNFIEIVWQASQVNAIPKDGNWVRVINKNKVFYGNRKLTDCGITSGDCIEIL